MVLSLRPNQLRKVPQRLRGIEHIAHNTSSLVDFLDKSVLSLLDSRARSLGIALLVLPASARARLRSIESKAGIGDGAARFVGALEALVQCRAPAGEEARLDLLVLVEARFADFLLRDSEFLEAVRQRVGLGGALRRGG
jgi:hypothetical protein